MLGSENDFTILSLPDSSPWEVWFSLFGNLRLRAFSCLPRQKGSSNLGNFFTSTVFFKFLAALAVFWKKIKWISSRKFSLEQHFLPELNRLNSFLSYSRCACVRQTSLRQSSTTCEITRSTTCTVYSEKWIVTKIAGHIKTWWLVLASCSSTTNRNDGLSSIGSKIQAKL